MSNLLCQVIVSITTNSHNCALFTTAEGTRIHLHLLIVQAAAFLYHTLPNSLFYHHFAGKLSPTNIFSFCSTTKFTILMHQELMWVPAGGRKRILMSSHQFSTQLYKTFPELNRLLMEALKFYRLCFQLTNAPLGNHVWKMSYKLRLKKELVAL